METETNILKLPTYDDQTQCVVVWDAKSRSELSRKIKEFYWRHQGCEGCPGRMRRAELLRAYRVDATWFGIVRLTAYYDI